MVMDFSVASSYISAVLHTSRSFLSTLFSICEIKPWSLQPDGHLENFGEGQENRSGWQCIIVTGHSELSCIITTKKNHLIYTLRFRFFRVMLVKW